MKKIISLAFASLSLALLFSISSCTKEPVIVSYNLGDKEVCLVSNVYQGYQTFTFNVSHSDITAVLTAAGYSDLAKATSVKLKDGIKAVSSTGNLDEILNVEVYFKVAGTSGDGDQIAYVQTLPTGATEAVLSVNGLELKPALTNDVTITVKVLNKTTGNSAKCYKITSGVFDISLKK